jgi:hypothetical protein
MRLMQFHRLAAVWLVLLGSSAACIGSDDPFDHAVMLASTAMAVADDRTAPLATPVTQLTQLAYIKASNTGEFDNFGYSVALSADGSTLAVGAPSEASAATGDGGDQADNSAGSSGAVYVFRRRGRRWVQQA